MRTLRLGEGRFSYLTQQGAMLPNLTSSTWSIVWQPSHIPLIEATLVCGGRSKG